MNNLAQLEKLCERFSIDSLTALSHRAKEAAQLVWEDQPVPLSSSDFDLGVPPTRPLTMRAIVEVLVTLEDSFDVNRIDWGYCLMPIQIPFRSRPRGFD